MRIFGRRPWIRWGAAFCLALTSTSHGSGGRIPIYQSDGPLTITNAGSYYLAHNLTSYWEPSTPAITIMANDVVLDLNGNRLKARDYEYAIFQPSDYANLTVKNGRVESRLGAYGSFSRLEDLTISIPDATLTAVNVGPDSVLTRCMFADNTVASILTGVILMAGAGTLVRDCEFYNSAADNRLEVISADDGVILQRCAVAGGTAPTEATGILAGDGALLNGVTVREVKTGTASSEHAVQLGAGALLTGCVLDGNVTAGADSLAAGCRFGNWNTVNVNSYQAQFGDGSLLVDNVFSGQVLGVDAVYIHSGSLAVGNRFDQNDLHADNGSLIAQNWANEPVHVTMDCYIFDNYLGRGIEDLAGWHRIEGNHLDGTNVCINSFGANNLIVRNYCAEDEDHVISGGANDHIAASIIPAAATFGTNRPWGNIVRLE